MPKCEIDPIELIKSINRNMPAEQVVANIRQYHQLDQNPTQTPTIAARDELLKRSGFIPQDWTFYTNFMPLYGQAEPNTQDWEMLKRNFPSEVEFLVVQGAFNGGFTGSPEQGSWGYSHYRYDQDVYSVFVRVKKQIG